MNPPTKKQAHIIWFALTGLAIAIVVALIVGTVWGLGRILDILSPVIWPIAIAAVVSCVLSPVVDGLEKRKVSRLKGIIIVFAAGVLLVAGLLASVVPQVVVETRELAHKVPEYSQKLSNRFNQLMSQPPAALKRFLPAHSDTAATSNSDETATNNAGSISTTTATTQKSDNQSATSVTDWMTGSLPRVGDWLLKQFGKVLSGFSFLAGLVLVPVYAFYFLLEKRTIEGRWRDYLPVLDSSVKQEVVFVVESISQYLVAFFRGQVLVAICDAVLYTIGFFALGLNYALLIGFAAVGLTMIPFIGAMVIFITALSLAFVQYTDWLHPMLVFGVFAIIQTLESLVISPKIIGDRVGLPPVIIIIAVMVGTTLLGGLLGGVLAIPLAAALRVILLRYVWKIRPESETKKAV